MVFVSALATICGAELQPEPSSDVLYGELGNECEHGSRFPRTQRFHRPVENEIIGYGR
jgi:hypothetical protein